MYRRVAPGWLGASRTDKLAAILAADVVGFSKMMGENEDRTLENLKACRALTDESIIANHGRIFGSAGDSISPQFDG
tara:strand:- start:25 stop:255 length:231 start_codon:yes stop_codon:yes gene_type:complete